MMRAIHCTHFHKQWPKTPWLPSALLLMFAGASWASELPEISERTTRQPHFFRPDLPNPRPVRKPSRIVSLAPVVTETLFAIDVGASVVGVTRYCDRPAAARNRPQVGGFVDPQLEAIVGLRPDLVIAMPSLGQRTVLDSLRTQGIPVLVVFGDTMDEIRSMIDAVGDATFQKEQAKKEIENLTRALQNIRERVPTHAARLRTVVVVQVDPLIIAGPNTFADEVLRWVGTSPAAPRNAPPWPTWSLEALLFLRPDVVIAAEGEESARRLQVMLAGQAGIRVLATDRAILMRPGPHLADDVEALFALLYPIQPKD